MEGGREWLQRVLEKEERPEILEYLGEHGKCELPDTLVGGDGEPWRQVASRELVPVLAAKDQESKTRIKYELTEQGEAVLDTWVALKNTYAVETTREAQNRDAREIAIDLLAEYFTHSEN